MEELHKKMNMTLTKLKEMYEAAKPLIEFLETYGDPHTEIIISPSAYGKAEVRLIQTIGSSGCKPPELGGVWVWVNKITPEYRPHIGDTAAI